MTSRVHICLATIVVFLLTSVLADTYYLTPTPSTLCPEEGDISCFTLSQYATNCSNFASNTTLILLPGNHSLELELEVSNITSLSISVKNPSQFDTVIHCSQCARFIFKNISDINMRGLVLTGCVNNSITSVEQFTLEDSSLLGQSRNGTGLTLNDVLRVFIVSSSFSSFFTGTEIPDTFLGGGALSTFNSEHISIFDCTFTNNTVSGDNVGGGAVLISCSSVPCVASIDNGSFIDNTATANATPQGGALWATNCLITLNSSLFESNGAVGSQSPTGGAVWANSSDVTVDNCLFMTNRVTQTVILSAVDMGGEIIATQGGAIFVKSSDVTLQNSLFVDNQVNGTYANGGAIRVDSGLVAVIDNSRFINNTAFGVTLSQGGALLSSSRATICKNSEFTTNRVKGIQSALAQGGALLTGYYNAIIISNCTFNRNTATSDRLALAGAIFAVTVFNTTDINNCTFIQNVARADFFAQSGALHAYQLSGSARLNVNGCIFHKNNVSGAFSAQGAAISAVNANASTGRIVLSEATTLSEVTISESEFTNNVVHTRGQSEVVYVYEEHVSLKNCILAKNNVGSGTVLTFINSNLTSYGYLEIFENTANTFVLIAKHTTMLFSGNITISNNSGLALQAFACPIVEFAGHTNIVNNTVNSESNTDVNQEAGTVTGIHSTLSFTGKTNIIYNTAIRGGAISAIQTITYVYGNTTIAHNRATISGGGIYAIQSNIFFVNTTTISLIENKGNERGGGIHAVGSIMWALDGSRTYITQNYAKRGGGACLESNSKLYIFKNKHEIVSQGNESIDQMNAEKWIQLKFIENSANFGGAVYVADDTNSVTCSATPFSGGSATSNECFIQGLG